MRRSRSRSNRRDSGRRGTVRRRVLACPLFSRPWRTLDLAGPSSTLAVSGDPGRAVLPPARARLSRLAEVQDEVDVLALRLGLKRVPDAWWIDARLTPMLWAVGCRPRVILPRDLWDKLDGRQRSMLLVHELAHVHRGDHAVRLFELARDGALLVAARRLVGPAGASRRRGAVLRRLGHLGLPQGRPLLRRDSAGNHRFRPRKRISRAGLGDRLRQGPSSPKEVDHDHAGNDAATPDLARRPGGLRRGNSPPAP